LQIEREEDVFWMLISTLVNYKFDSMLCL